MAKTKTETTPKNRNLAQATLNVDIDALAESAPASRGFLPIASFGEKTTPGTWVVTFRDTKPRTVEKDFGDGAQRLAIDVTKARLNDDGSTGPATDESIFLRLLSKDDVEKAEARGEEAVMHSLTAGVLALYRESGKDLRNVRAVIRKRVYKSKRAGVGMTCSYDVLARHEDAEE